MPGVIPDEVLAARRQAGEALSAAREAAGRNVEELAAQLKVSPAKIAALESGDWSALPDETFARALLRSCCKALRIDAAPLLALLPGVPAVVNPVEAAQTGDSAVTMPQRPLPRGGSAGGRPRGLWWLALLLVAVAAAVYFWPAYAPLLGGLRGGANPSGAETAVEPASAVAPPAAASAVLTPTPPASAVPASAAAPAASVPQSPASAPAAPASGAAAALQLQSSAPSWVEVRSKGGKVVFSQTVQPGAPQTLSVPAASAPLIVVVGNAPQTTLVYAGKSVDLAAKTHANVARLTLP
jgi:cytoskeleton protein RodZ